MYNLFYMEVFAVVMGFPAAMTYMDVFYCLCTGKRMFRWGALLLEVYMLVLPPLLLYFFDAGDRRGNYTIIFPLYRPIVYTLILLCLVVYFYAMWRKRLAAPLLEIVIHCFLLLGVVLNILVAMRMRTPDTLFLINLPAALLLILALARSHRLLLYTLEDEDVLEPAPRGWPKRTGGSVSEGQSLDLSGKRVIFFGVARFPDLNRVCFQLLRMRPAERTAILIILSLPVLAPLMKIFLSAGRVH